MLGNHSYRWYYPGNPSVGAASDKLIQLGGTSILNETTELIGAKHLVAAPLRDQRNG